MNLAQPKTDPPTVLERYQFKPSVGSSHSWAIAQMSRLSPDARILDIGCGSGAIGATLKNLGFSNLNAIEVDPAAATNARSIYSRVESKLDSFSNEKFECIFMLDVLEHLPDPFEYIANLPNYISDDGYLIISVPNVAHWSIRLSLLFGFFEYTDRGILDRTHLQFFNRKRFKSLLRHALGMTEVELSASIEPIELLLPKTVWNNSFFASLSKIRVSFANILPGLMAYQHLAIFRRKFQ